MNLKRDQVAVPHILFISLYIGRSAKFSLHAFSFGGANGFDLPSERSMLLAPFFGGDSCHLCRLQVSTLLQQQSGSIVDVGKSCWP